jgi:5-methylcytosine-specific restriction endonuclease McrA
MSGLHWTADQVTALRKAVSSGMSIYGASSTLSRSSNAVQIKANRLGLKFRGFSEAEENAVRRGYSEWDGLGTTIGGIAAELGRSASSVVAFAKRLGLTDIKRPHPWAKREGMKRWTPILSRIDSYRGRARKLYPLGACEGCGAPASDRHHRDENPRNNSRGNISQLCRRCHMKVDGRLERLKSMPRAAPMPAKPCSVCGVLSKPLRKGKCHSCHEFYRRNGVDKKAPFRKRAMSSRRISPGAYAQDAAMLRAGAEIPRGPAGRRLCRRCNTEVPANRQTFCSKECVHLWRILTDPNYVRIQLVNRDHGICAKCGKDAVADLPVRLQGKARGSGHLWQADHIIPVAEGGGECGLENYRTLCTACHKSETAALLKRISRRRLETKSAAPGVRPADISMEV